MKRTGTFVMVIALAAAAGVAYAGPQATTTETAAPQKKAAKDADKKITMKNLPAAVKATVEAESKNATLKGVSKEVEKGKTQYEVETIVNGRTRDLLVDPAGKVLEVEEQLDLDAAPAPVKAALQTTGKLLRLETVTKGSAVTYDARVQAKSGKKSEISLDASGKAIKP